MFQPLDVQLSYEHPPPSLPPPLPRFPPRCTVQEEKGEAGAGRVCVCAPSLSQGVSALAIFRRPYLTLVKKTDLTKTKQNNNNQINETDVLA